MKGDLLLCTWDNPSVNKILAWFIRLFTKSDYVHIAMMSDDFDTIVEAVTPRVQQTKNYWKNYAVYRVNCAEYQKDMALKFARNQVGDWYDFRALLYLGWLYLTLQRSKINDWNEENRWFCSELVCTSFREAGVVLCPEIADTNASPQDIASSLKVTKIC
jgi:uncharacterized protein YycO